MISLARGHKVYFIYDNVYSWQGLTNSNSTEHEQYFRPQHDWLKFSTQKLSQAVLSAGNRLTKSQHAHRLSQAEIRLHSKSKQLQNWGNIDCLLPKNLTCTTNLCWHKFSCIVCTAHVHLYWSKFVVPQLSLWSKILVPPLRTWSKFLVPPSGADHFLTPPRSHLSHHLYRSGIWRSAGFQSRCWSHLRRPTETSCSGRAAFEWVEGWSEENRQTTPIGVPRCSSGRSSSVRGKMQELHHEIRQWVKQLEQGAPANPRRPAHVQNDLNCNEGSWSVWILYFIFRVSVLFDVRCSYSVRTIP